MSHPEKILVVPAAAVAEHLGEGLSRGCYPAIDALIRPGVAELRVRDEVEHDPAWKQIVSYVTFYSHVPDSVFTYVRAKAGGESRLHDLLSIGVGGHTEEKDLPEWPHISPGCLYQAALRELVEEVYVFASAWGELTPYRTVRHFMNGTTAEQFPDITLRRIGLLNDNSNDVGRCHLGVVYTGYTPSQGVQGREDHLADPCWKSPAALLAPTIELEGWSKIVLDAMIDNPSIFQGRPRYASQGLLE
jgi:predicted NUDIX family phosphoesterase